jgi:CzcA family heavy metal efflux pump
MIDRLIRWSLANRILVLCAAALLLVYGSNEISRMPVDVFPDLNRPTVTVMSESQGLAPEEVESLVTFPLESALNGATGVQRVRSVSSIGLSIVWVEFDWGTPIFEARQIVTEKLSALEGRLANGVKPVLTPISSIMGEIMLVSASSRTGQLSPMALRTIADWQIRQRLMAIPGISQVTVIGGEVRQLQVLANPNQLLQRSITLKTLTDAVRQSNLSSSGGFIEEGGQESLVRNLGRANSVEQIGNTVVAERQGRSVLVKDLARVAMGARFRRGDASTNASPAVILSIQKQPSANTVELTHRLESTFDELRKTLPPDAVLEPLFEQKNFIEAAVNNVKEALRDGSIMVAFILLVFLLNFRTTAITLTAIPLSFVVAGLSMKAMGLTINTMTLGGLAVAIGELVDDAVVDVENVYRRLQERPDRPVLETVYHASSEVRSSIIYSTILICLVFFPLFFLQGMEGRLFAPLGVAYVISLLASLVVSLTVTPALCSYLLKPSKALVHKDSPVVAFLKRLQERGLRFTLAYSWLTLGLVALLFGVAVFQFSRLGRDFLPPFNEGTLTLTVIAQPGTSLEESNRLGRAAERRLLQVPEVTMVGRRTGRAELDEHAEGVHSSEIDVDLKPGRPREAVLSDIRRLMRDLPGVELNLGQPISHRLDHILSGVRAQVAIKIFGPDLSELRRLATEVQEKVKTVDGVVDLSTEKQVLVPELRIELDREAGKRYGVRSGELAETLETALAGTTVSQVLEGQRVFDLTVRLDDPFRSSSEAIRKVLVDTDSGPMPLENFARLVNTQGPNQVLRENVTRRIVVSSNVQGRDLGTVVQEMKVAVNGVKLPPGYFLEFGGQFESQVSATRALASLSVFSLVGIFLVLYHHFRLARLALMVMAALPLSMIGGVIGVVATGQNLSVASLVGFITLCGIASRNEIMRISHYLHLMEVEGEVFGIAMILRGSAERMVPVMMTALTAILALVPLVLASGQPGKEILHPVAVVIFSGLLISTLLDTVVTPVLFHLFGSPVFEQRKAIFAMQNKEQLKGNPHEKTLDDRLSRSDDDADLTGLDPR